MTKQMFDKSGLLKESPKLRKNAFRDVDQIFFQQLRHLMRKKCFYMKNNYSTSMNLAAGLLLCTWLSTFSCHLVTAFMGSGFSPPDSTIIYQYRQQMSLQAMKRPLLDQLASTLFRLENARVEKSSVTDEKGRVGEPMEWSENSSFANQFSEMVASNSVGYKFKQWIADIVAGDFDEDATNEKIERFVADNPVAMFSFSTCPFCRRAKDYLKEQGIQYQSMELDELDGNEGNEIRAVLGKKTRRTSVPSIFIGGKSIGGCNDGPGLVPLSESGELDKLLKAL
jgi:glutaredoxin 3